MGALRLALVGAFPFPLPQGSQVFFEEQARALDRAGCECTLFTYGRGVGPPPSDLRVVTTPTATTPARMRTGPSLAKPLADAALLRTLLRAMRSERYDAVLAHHAEAAAVALAARARTGVPVCYVVHTLLAVELSTFLPHWTRGAADAAGRRVDRILARHADSLIVLGDSAARALRSDAGGEIVVLPPGLTPQPAPDDDAIDRACAQYRLQRDGFFFYSGNLDGYQEIELLADAAARLPEAAPPVVVATHGDVDEAAREALRPLRIVHVDDFDVMRALMHGATALLLARRRVGGYPVKLLNYMEAARAIVAFEEVAEGLVHGESAWLVAADHDRPGAAIAEALIGLHQDEPLRAKLGRGARAHLEAAHDPDRLAAETVTHLQGITRVRD